MPIGEAQLTINRSRVERSHKSLRYCGVYSTINRLVEYLLEMQMQIAIESYGIHGMHQTHTA